MKRIVGHIDVDVTPKNWRGDHAIMSRAVTTWADRETARCIRRISTGDPSPTDLDMRDHAATTVSYSAPNVVLRMVLTDDRSGRDVMKFQEWARASIEIEIEQIPSDAASEQARAYREVHRLDGPK